MRSSEIVTRPWCPFCGQNVGKPVPPTQRKLGEFSGGRCGCGAVYTCDPSGRNIGAAMVDALVYACNDDWDLAWELAPEEDYLTGIIEPYDEQTHQLVETGRLDGRHIHGVLYFVRLHKAITEIVERVATRQTAVEKGERPQAAADIEPERDPKRLRKRAEKNRVAALVQQGEVDELVDLLFDDRRTLRFMQRLLYLPDEQQRWQAVHILGRVCGRYATRRPGAISDLLHRLFAAASDSAATSWGTVEAIGAIIAERPDVFGAFTRHLLRYMGDPSTQLYVLWALGTIAQPRPDLIRALPFYNMLTFLGHPEPALRGLSLRLFGRIRAIEARTKIAELKSDTAAIIIYEEGAPRHTTVGQLAAEALALIDQQNGSEKYGN